MGCITSAQVLRPARGLHVGSWHQPHIHGCKEDLVVLAKVPRFMRIFGTSPKIDPLHTQTSDCSISRPRTAHDPLSPSQATPMLNYEPGLLQRRTLLAGFVALATTTVIGGSSLMAAIEQNTLKRRGVGLWVCEPERAFPGFTLFAPHFVQNRNVYLIDLKGEVVHTWTMPYPPGLSGYLTERGTLFYNGRTSEESFLSRFPFKGGVVLEADWNGKVLWEVRHPDHHHHG